MKITREVWEELNDAACALDEMADRRGGGYCSKETREWLEQNEPPDLETLGKFDALEVKRRDDGLTVLYLGLKEVQPQEWARNLLIWVGDLLEAQRPRKYKSGDIVPARILWWAGDHWAYLGGNCLSPGDIWLPMPPPTKEKDE